MNKCESIITSFLLRTLQRPFYGALLAQIEVNTFESPQKLLGYTDGKSIFINVKDMNTMDAVVILLHELMHIMLLHIPRKGHRDALLWNVACDLCINSILEKEIKLFYAFTSHQLSIPLLTFEHFHIPQTVPPIEEEVYDWLEKNCKFITVEMDLLINGVNRTVRVLEHEKHKLVEDLFGRMSETAIREIKSKILKAYESCKGRGYLPAPLERIINIIVRPTLNWQQILQEFISVKTHLKYRTWKRISRRYWPDLYLKGKIRLKRPNVVVALDVSGSISDDMLARFVTETYEVLKHSYALRLIQCDAAVHEDIMLETDNDIKNLQQKTFVRKGGGGTDFRPVFKHLLKQPYTVDVLIYFTDLNGTFPDNAPPFETLWVTTEDIRLKPPFGKVIHLDLKRR